MSHDRSGSKSGSTPLLKSDPPSQPVLRLIYLCTSNVCRSSFAEAVAAGIVAECKLDSSVYVASRGLTDGYSPWGHPAEPRMTLAAKKMRVRAAVLSRMAEHKSAMLTQAEAADPDTILFLVTSHHIDWTRQAVGSEVIADAQMTGRLRLIDSSGGDVADPYFGGQEEYNTVAAHILAELPRTLDAVLRERGLLEQGDVVCKPPIVSGTECSDVEVVDLEAAASAGREYGAIQGGAYAPRKRQ